MSNNKKGFIYYSVETNRYEDKRIKRLKKDMGCAGICVYDKILCEIYRVEGCFIQWDADTVFDVAEYFGLKESLVNEIVAYCCHVGLFKKELYDSEKVLTSQSIQSRFIDWSKKARRINFKIPDKYVIDQEEYPKLTEDCTQNHNILKQSKVKESKEKKTSVDTREDKNHALEKPDIVKSNLFRKPRIPTLQEVHEVFIRNGGTEEMAKAFFNRNEATEWFFKGSPITNYVSMVGSFIDNWKRNEQKSKEVVTEKPLTKMKEI